VGGLGSAIIAGYGVGIFDDMESTAKRFIATKNRIEPNMERHAYYKQFAELYIDMFEMMNPLYDRLSKISATPKP
jgi:sugar (pentulose or hexulose) kinase